MNIALCFCVKNCGNYLSDIFKNRIEFINLCLLSKLSSASLSDYEEANESFQAIKDDLPFEVPFTYWWPINTSHAVNAATSFK